MGGVHFPEDALRSYVRVFCPESAVEETLDAIARAALDAEVADVAGCYALAHQTVSAGRVSVETSAVVLVAEAGVDRTLVARALGLTPGQVDQAVADAWQATVPAPHPPAEPESPPPPGDQPPPPADITAPAEPPVDTAAEPPVDTAAEPPADRVPRRRRLRGAGTALLLAALASAVVWLAVLAFSDLGSARLQRRGIDPAVAVAAVVVLLGVGVALDRIGAASGRRDNGSEDG